MGTNRTGKRTFFEISFNNQIFIVNMRSLRPYDHRIVKAEKIRLELFDSLGFDMKISVHDEHRFVLGQIYSDIPRAAHPRVKIIKTKFIYSFVLAELFKNLMAVKDANDFSGYPLQVIQQCKDIVWTMRRKIQNRNDKAAFFRTGLHALTNIDQIFVRLFFSFRAAIAEDRAGSGAPMT